MNTYFIPLLPHITRQRVFVFSVVFNYYNWSCDAFNNIHQFKNNCLMFHEFLYLVIVCTGLTLNLSTIAIVLIKTTKELKEYSILLLNTSFVELSSIIAYLLINCRLFTDHATAISISDGPCMRVSDEFCLVVTCFVHINMMHSNSLIALSFWYRTRVLHEMGNVGKFRLQTIILLLFVPHMFHIAFASHAASPRETLEPVLDLFYGSNSTVSYGLHGFLDIFALQPALVFSYLIVIPVFFNNYIVYARKNLLGILRDKMRHMSSKTRGIHESFTQVLTISAATSAVFAPSVMIGSVIAQIVFRIHSVDIEGLIYHGAVLPALVNPTLTLYFVKAYRMFILSFFTRRIHKVSTTSTYSLQYTV